ARPCCPYRRRPPSRAVSPSFEPVQVAAVVPEDLLLRVVADLELEEPLDRRGKLRIRVREVGGEHEAVGQTVRDGPPARVLVRFERRVALTPEVITRIGAELASKPAVPAQFHVLVHSPQEEREPAAVALEERDPKVGVALQDPPTTEGH